MSLTSKKALRIVAAALAIGFLSPQTNIRGAV
jgi:hypothetical protein